MSERSGLVTFLGNPVTLMGDALDVGDGAPDFVAVSNDLAPVDFKKAYAGKVCILAAVPSLDTPVCDTETRKFNEKAAALGEDVAVLTISMDLPFAQKRWCGAAGIDRVETLSDYMAAEFGKKYGVLMKESHLLARAVFVVDRDGKVRHVEIVKEIAEEPDYEAVLAAAKAAL